MSIQSTNLVQSHSTVVVALSIVGVASIVALVCKIAYPKIKNYSLMIYHYPFCTNMRALFCRVCALRHNAHKNVIPESLKKENLTRMPTPFSQVNLKENGIELEEKDKKVKVVVKV